MATTDEPTGEGITRRKLFVHGGGAASAFGLASLAGIVPLANAVAAGGALSESRRRTYSAMLEAVARVPDSGVSGDLDAATERFARWYENSPPEAQSFVNGVLDALADGQAGGFANASPRARLQMLRAWSHAEDGDRSHGKQKSPVALATLSYATLPFHDDPDRPLEVARI